MGPLKGFKIIEIAGLGPGPFAAMMLGDMGADVVRIDRIANTNRVGDDFDREMTGSDPKRYAMARSRRSIALDLKHPQGSDAALRVIERADALIEGFRPGVMERLGLGPEACFERNPRLVYGRITGWGQDGPLAHRAGHDITYIALAGVLNGIRRAGERPVPPLSLVGDFAGGGMMLSFGIVCGLLEASRSGRGQIIDSAMVDGAALLSTLWYGLLAQGRWRDEPGTNFADTGAPWYEVYETADSRHVAVGANEGPFYDELVKGLELEDLPSRADRSQWSATKKRFAVAFKSKTLDEWRTIFEQTDACVAPVLSFSDARKHPHNAARETFVEHHGVMQPAPAPRFSRTRPELSLPPPTPGEHTEAVLLDWGFDQAEIAQLRDAGVIG